MAFLPAWAALDSLPGSGAAGVSVKAVPAEDDSDDDSAAAEGWQPANAGLTMSYFRASDTTRVQTGGLELDLSKGWHSGKFTLTPSLSLLMQRSLTKDSLTVRSLSGQLGGAVAPFSWISLSAAGFYTTQIGPDDFGGYGCVRLTPKAVAHFEPSVSASLSKDYLGALFPSAEVSVGQDFDVIQWSLDGNWSYQSVTYEASRLHTTTNVRGVTKADTVSEYASKYINEWEATFSLGFIGEVWKTGPFAIVTLQSLPLGTDVVAVKTGAKSPSRSSQSATSKNQTLELGWNGTLSPSDWLDLDLSVSNVWATQKVNLKGKGVGMSQNVSQTQLSQRAKYLKDNATPLAAGLNLSLGASVDF